MGVYIYVGNLKTDLKKKRIKTRNPESISTVVHSIVLDDVVYNIVFYYPCLYSILLHFCLYLFFF